MNSIAAFFNNTSNTQILTETFVSKAFIPDSITTKITEKFNDVFNKTTNQKLESNSKEFTKFKENLSEILKDTFIEEYKKANKSHLLNDSTNDNAIPPKTETTEKKNFRNFMEFINSFGNFLCFPISKILKIFYYNINFQKLAYQINVQEETETGSSAGNKAFTSKYSKSIDLLPQITINKPKNTYNLKASAWIKNKVKNGFIVTACAIAILVFSVFIALGITLKLIALSNPSIRKDYKSLKEFFIPKNIELGKDKPITENYLVMSKTAPLDKHNESIDLKNIIIDTLTLHVEHSRMLARQLQWVKDGTTINALTLKNLILKVKNSNPHLSDVPVYETYKFPRFSEKGLSSTSDHPIIITFSKPNY